MFKPRNVRRKTTIAKILAKHGFGFAVEKIGLGRLVPFHWGVLGHKKRKERYSAPEHLRMAFEELGPTFIKLGQILSTRPDLLPDEYIEEFTKLQDKIPPCSFGAIKDVIEEELSRDVGDVFNHIEEEPLASASIGQVHRAELKNGEKVVIKVQKPGVEKQIKQDLEILEEVGRRIVNHSDLAKRWDVEGFLSEFSYTLRNELDYVREGRNAETFRKNFQKDGDICIPKVYWEFTTRRVLVLEEIKGIKILDQEDISGLRLNGKEIAMKTANMYLNMFFRDGFFHADPHPGNFFVLKDGRIALLDFGMVGVLDDYMRINLMQMIYAMSKGDMSLVMDALYDLGMQADPQRESMLRKEFEVLFSYYFLQPLGNIKLSHVINETFRLAYKYNVSLPSDLFLLLKTIAMGEGLMMRLDPDFRMINAAEPYVRKWKRLFLSPKFISSQAEKNVIMLSKLIMESVEKSKRFLKRVDTGKLELSVKYEGETRFINDLRKDINRLSMSLLTLGFIVSVSLVFTAYKPDFLDMKYFAYIVSSVAVILLAGVIFKIVKEGT